MTAIAGCMRELADHLAAAGWNARFAVRETGTGGLAVTITPPDVDDLGYTGVPCPPGPRVLGAGLLLVAATADEEGAWGLLDALDRLAADAHAAGWAPSAAQAVDVNDRPGYLIRIDRRVKG